MGRVQGKVAFVTGAARGQGRSHAVRLAEEGADIIAVDLCQDIPTIGYPMATPEDLEGDRPARREDRPRRRHGSGRRARARPSFVTALERGIAEFGKLDIVVAQAGIAGMKGQPPLQAWVDVINTNLIGTINAIHVALPHLQEGASIVATGSTAALMDAATASPIRAPTPAAWPTWSPSGCCRATCTTWRPSWRRAASAPTSSTRRTATPTCCRASRCTGRSGPTWSTRPWRTREPVFHVQQAMTIPWVEPVDISNAVLYLASDEARYVTGMQLRVDAGGYLKWYDYHD